MTSRCVICPTRPARPPLHDSRACDPCTRELQRMLDDLHRLIATVRALLVEFDHANDGIRHTRGAAGPAPLRVDVLSLLDDRATDGPDEFLRTWADRLKVGYTPTALAAVLSRIVERDDLEQFARQLRALHAELGRVCGDPQPAVVATCRRPRRRPDGTTRECRGPITATPGGDTAACTRCGDQWPRSRWKLLGRIEQAG